MLVLQRSQQIPRIPKEYVRPKIVAGINALGRGQDREALTQFMQVVAGVLGPQSIPQYINASEAIKRLAAAQGIDILNLVKTDQQLQQETEQAQQQQMQASIVDQAGQLAGTPMMDPEKNPDALDTATAISQMGLQQANQQPPQ